jgi:dienelactone hydrolase
VVVSSDYLERGPATQALSLTLDWSPSLDSAITRTALAMVEFRSAAPNTPFHGAADPHEVAAVGHSAGGQTAFDALALSSVRTAVGWAKVAPSGAPSSKPVMLIGAEGDDAVLPSNVQKTYRSFPGPKVLVEISGEGHNTYTDICVGIRQGGVLINDAVAHGYTTPQLAKLASNGCAPSDPAPQRFWPIVQFYTVLQLENQFAGDTTATVQSPTPGRFPGFTVTVTQAA